MTRLSDVMVSKCFSRFSGAAFTFYILFGTYYLTQVASFVFEVIRLLDMYRFYTYLLGIPDVRISRRLTVGFQTNATDLKGGYPDYFLARYCP